MQRERAADLLRDVLDFINKIESWQPAPNTPADDKTLYATLHALQYIGEAVNRLPLDVMAMAPQIPWSNIRAMRNIIAHDYTGIDEAIVRKTVAERLPELRAAVTSLLSELSR
jgi:uncharacterized protein with HEPN domain